jgi:PhnB protein
VRGVKTVSKIQLSTYINFQGKAREAMELYQKLLGGDLVLYTTDEQGASKPAGPGDTITYSRLDSESARIVGVDGNPNYPASAGDNMALSVSGSDRERLGRIFDGLAEGGKTKMPLRKQPWGPEAGWLVDRFGINWTVSVDNA